jgi:hypothetical protein
MDLHPIELTQGHINQATLPWREESRKKFPAVKKGAHIRVVDNDTAKEYRGFYGRGRTNEWISGLKGFFNDHPNLHSRDVVTVSLDPDGTLRLSATGTERLDCGVESIQEETTCAPLERLVEDSLEKNPAQLEEGLRVHPQGRQFRAGGGRIDLLCTDKDGRYVVVEIKRWKAVKSSTTWLGSVVIWRKERRCAGLWSRMMSTSGSRTPSPKCQASRSSTIG